MLGRTNTGGGAGLNFKVIGNPKPETAKENTIWIDADEINGWAFSATEPEITTPGMVWISIGTSSSVAFNALKKHSAMIYPISAKQYVGGAWVKKTAQSYQNGAWVEWIPAGALYYYGDQCVDVSGGWIAKGIMSDDSHTGKVVPSVTFNSDHMEINVPNGGNNSGGMVTVDAAQDLTYVNKVIIDYEVPNTTGYVTRLMAIKENAKYLSDAGDNVEVLASNNDSVVNRKTVALDVSSVRGSYDIAIGFHDHWSGSGSVKVKVYSVIKE